LEDGVDLRAAVLRNAARSGSRQRNEEQFPHSGILGHIGNLSDSYKGTRPLAPAILSLR
jgi:hypothetical protein